MSILNVYLLGDSALVGVDSLFRPQGVGNAEQDHHGCKLYPIPLCNAIFAARGERNLNVLCAMLLSKLDVGSFDELSAKLPHAFGWAVENLRLFDGDESEVDTDGQRALVGWSEETQAMRCLWMKLVDGTLTIVDSYLDHADLLIAPDVDLEEAPAATPEAIRDLGRIQVKVGREDQFRHTIGGQMLVATLSRDSLTIRNMGDLG